MKIFIQRKIVTADDLAKRDHIFDNNIMKTLCGRVTTDNLKNWTTRQEMDTSRVCGNCQSLAKKDLLFVRYGLSRATLKKGCV